MTKASQTRTQRIESIEVGPRRRPVSQEKVTELARSISELGLLQPIGITEDRQLVYGTHRLEACRLLGWTEIQATVLPDCDELTRELAEIDENLIRSELTVLLEDSFRVINAWGFKYFRKTGSDQCTKSFELQVWTSRPWR